MPNARELSKMKSEYDQWLELFGDDERSVGWNKPKQKDRFSALILPLLNRLPQAPFDLVDLGCGLGHLQKFLKDSNIQAGYTGVDVNEKLISRATELREGKFYVGTEIPCHLTPDVIVACGLFNRKFSDSENFFEKTLRHLIERAKFSVAFTCLSHKALQKHEGNFYVSLSDLESLIDRQILSGFAIDGASLPGELIVHLYKNYP